MRALEDATQEYDDITDDITRLVDGDAGKSRLQVYRRGDDWFCTFTNGVLDTDEESCNRSTLNWDCWRNVY